MDIPESDRILLALEIFRGKNEEIFEDGPRRIVRKTCMQKGGLVLIMFYHVCDVDADLPLPIGKRVFQVGIWQIRFVLKKWRDLPAFITQVREVFGYFDKNPNHGSRDEIYQFINDLVNILAQEHQKLFNMTNVCEELTPTAAERSHCEEVSEALNRAKGAGIDLVVNFGDASQAAPAHSESDMYRQSCHVCGCLIPCRPGDEIEARSYDPRVPSYSEPTKKRGRTGFK